MKDAAGSLDIVSAQRWQESVRTRAVAHDAQRASRSLRYVRWLAWAVAVLVHLLIGVTLYLAMKPHYDEDKDVLHVELHDAPLPPPPLPEPPAKSESPSETSPAPTRSVANPNPLTTNVPITNAEAQTTPTPSVRVYNPDGSLNVPKDILDRMDKAQRPNFYSQAHEDGMKRAQELMTRGHNLLHCKRTDLDDSSTPETVGAQTRKGIAGYHALFDGLNRYDPRQQAQNAVDINEAGDEATEQATIAARACDDQLWHAPSRNQAPAPADDVQL